MHGEIIVNGRVWLIAGAEGNLINDIDTDQIFHNAYLSITDINEMGKYAFGNLAGWRDFPQKARAGDILVVGKNFGAGSSRQQAVDCFRALGISLILGESFGAIYKRNAINSGFALMTCPGIVATGLKNGDAIEVNIQTGEIRGKNACNVSMNCKPFSDVQLEIYRAGNLFAYGRKMEG